MTVFTGADARFFTLHINKPEDQWLKLFILYTLMVTFKKKMKNMGMAAGTVKKANKLLASISYSNLVRNLDIINLVKQKLYTEYGFDIVTY